MSGDGSRPNQDAEVRELDAYDLTNASCRLLKLALKRAGELIAEEIGEAGLRPRPFMTLIAIYQNPGITQNDLVKTTGSDRSTIGELTHRFETRGYITRERDKSDQRVNRLFVTAAGTEALQKSLQGTRRAEARFRATIPAGKRHDFFEVLARLGEDGEATQRPPGVVSHAISTA